MRSEFKKPPSSTGAFGKGTTSVVPQKSKKRCQL